VESARRAGVAGVRFYRRSVSSSGLCLLRRRAISRISDPTERNPCSIKPQSTTVRVVSSRPAS
jgi:hypothetical protein